MNNAILALEVSALRLRFAIYEVQRFGVSPITRGEIDHNSSQLRLRAKEPSGAVKAVDLQGMSKRFECAEAFSHLLQWLRERYANRYEPVAVGHRVTHGGQEFAAPTLITSEVLDKLDRLIVLEPLHQQRNLAGIRAAQQARPDIPQVACFDTAFHRGRATTIERFGLPNDMFKRGLRRWGFHGLSYASVAAKLKAIAPEAAAGRVIVVHLGSDASMCAMRDGRSVDTTTSFSTLDGLPTGTRCGSLDPAAVLHLLKYYLPDHLETLLNHRCGLAGVSGISGDLSTLLTSTAPAAREAIDFFIYNCVRQLGSLTAALHGIDALVFSGEFGKSSPIIRSRICEEYEWLGISLDRSANESGRSCISIAGRTPSVWVIPSDELLMIATETRSLLRLGEKIKDAVDSISNN